MKSPAIAPEARLQDAAPDFARLYTSFMRSASVSVSERTVSLYSYALRTFYRYPADSGMPLDPASVTREHIEAYILHLRTAPNPRTRKPYSEATQYSYTAAVRAFYTWLLEVDEIRDHPMARIKTRPFPETVVEVLSDAQVSALLKACRGNGYFERRDHAIVALFIDTGLRRRELTDLRLEDIDWQRGELLVRRGKGGKPRYVGLSRKALNLLNLYVNHARHAHTDAASPWLWLGARGRMTPDGIAHAIQKRAEAAGPKGFHLHLLRHYFAHCCKSEGMSDEDLETLGGWSRGSTAMRRYGRSAAKERAIEAHRRHSPLSKL